MWDSYYGNYYGGPAYGYGGCRNLSYGRGYRRGLGNVGGGRGYGLEALSYIYGNVGYASGVLSFSRGNMRYGSGSWYKYGVQRLDYGAHRGWFSTGARALGLGYY